MSRKTYAILLLAIIVPLLIYFFNHHHEQASNTPINSTETTLEFNFDVPSQKIVRVGMFDYMGFSTVDRYGLREGYGYEYLQEIAYRAGWRIKYVDDSFSNLTQMLEKGEIDVMMNVSRTPEREKHMLFPSRPQGEERYYIYIDPEGNGKINAEDMQSLQGAVIGCDANSYTEEICRKWAKDNGIELTFKEYTGDKNWNDLKDGTIDGMAAADMSLVHQVVPAFNFGESEFFFAISKSRPDLMEDINTAQSDILAQYPSYNATMKYRYYTENNESAYLNPAEREWIENHQVLKIGCLKDYMPMSYYDGKELKGLISYVLQEASDKTGITFEVVAYDTYDNMLKGLENGDVSAIFPWTINYSSAEKNGLLQTTSVYRYSRIIVYKDGYDEQNDNRMAIRIKYYPSDLAFYSRPDIKVIKCNNFRDCLDAVNEGRADYMITNSYNINELSSWISDYPDLTVSQTDSNSRIGFALARNNPELMSIMNSVILSLNANDVNSYTFISSQNTSPYTIYDFMHAYGGMMIGLIGTIAILILIKLIKENMAKKALTTANIQLARANNELEKTHTALEDALEAANRANNSKTVFLSNVSHDMRTPLNAIIGFATLINQAPGDAMKVKEDTRKILSSGKHLLSIIDDVLDVSKIETGHFILNPEHFILGELLDTIDIIIRPQTNRKHQRFEISAEGLRQMNFEADVNRIQQILLNILSNAMKYTPQGGHIYINVKEVASTGDDCSNISFSISDNGRGMSEGFQKKLFSPFAREELFGSEEIQGTGLGLAITKNLIDILGGSISVNSRLGEGSTFIVIIPMNHADTVKKDAPQKDFSDALNGLHILAAEDNDINAEILTKMLKLKGASVTITPNGRQALDAFMDSETGSYDIIFMDIMMPVMNGYEATKAIRALADDDSLPEAKRQEARDIPIIAMTANAFNDDVQKSLLAGMDAHTTKPINLEKVCHTVADVLSRKKG